LAWEYVARTSLRVAAEDATDRIAVGRREVLAHAGRVGLPRPLPVDLVDHVAVDDPRMGAGARVARDELVARGEARRGAAAAVAEEERVLVQVAEHQVLVRRHLV